MAVKVSSKKLTKQDQLVMKSARLFRYQSFHATSMNDIADAGEMNKGTLYYYYASKGDILFAIYTTAIEELNSRIDALNAQLPPDELLVQHMRAILQTIVAVPDLIAVYFQERHWLEKTLSSDQVATIRAQEKLFNDRLAGIIARGVKAKLFRPLDQELLATQLLASAQSFNRWHLPRSKANVNAIAETTVGFVLDGIRRT